MYTMIYHQTSSDCKRMILQLHRRYSDSRNSHTLTQQSSIFTEHFHMTISQQTKFHHRRLNLIQKIQQKESYFDVSPYSNLTSKTATNCFQMTLCLALMHHHTKFDYKRVSSSGDMYMYGQKDTQTLRL